mmetsp:Transcript_24009/g.73550  ORF Transcript_24009/g.73550 Transcript_24009/m.73550 type:complete len:244 (+) Transcript_24009:966-1697(+)
MIARRALVEDRPNGGEMVDANRIAGGFHLLVRLRDPLGCKRSATLVFLSSSGRGDELEEGGHGAEHRRCGGEGANDVGNAQGVLRVEALHQRALTTHDADGHATAERLAVCHHVGLNAVILLCATNSHAEAGVNLVEEQGDVDICTKRAELLEPDSVLVVLVRSGASFGRHQNKIRWGRRARVKPLQGRDENSSDLVRACADNFEGVGRKILESQHVGDWALGARASLDAVPPSVVRADELHD